MNLKEAKKIVDHLAFQLGRMRSNAIEGLGGYGKNWENIGEVNQRVLEITMPGLFGPKNVLDIAITMQEKGDGLNPNDLYNLIFLARKDASIEFMITVMWPGAPLPVITPPPAWIAGWDPEVCPVCLKNPIAPDRDGTCVDCSH